MSGPDRTEDFIQNTESFDGDSRLMPVRDLSRSAPGDIQKIRDYQESILSKPATLADYLIQQLGVLDLSKTESLVAHEIIGDIDEDGRFSATTDDVAKAADCTTDMAEKVLKKIQQLDPPGVGGRNLREILLIQLSRKESRDARLAHKMIEQHLELVEKKKLTDIAKSLGVSMNNVMAAYEVIRMLEPRPGAAFMIGNSTDVKIDAAVYPNPEAEGEFVIDIMDDEIPEIRINPVYRALLKDKKTDAQTKQFIKQKIQSGLDLIRAISQRKSTIRQITEEIVKEQGGFLLNGLSHLKPLRLKDISGKIGVHESTVSRAIQNKYILTPQGAISYRNFFSTKLETDDGASESQKSVMERIKSLIQEENRKKPLSDAKIVNCLRQDGILISRRTVAKYRDRLKILPTHLRKQ